MKPLYPLTVFEEYMLVDETVDHPMTFLLRVDFVGRVDVDAFRAAFSEVVSRHPIFWSTVVRRFRPRHSWKIVSQRSPRLQARHVKSLGECDLKSHIDLQREPGIRAQLNLLGPNAELWLQFHHSCSDGIGGLRFLEELLEAYRIRSSAGAASASHGVAFFPTGRCAYENLSLAKRLRRLARELPRIWAFLRRPLVELKERSIVGRVQQRTATPSFLEARLPLTKTMRQQLKRTHPMALTVNDVLLRDVYLALGDWIRNQHPDQPRRWIRISAAVNMRNRGAEEIRCHNDVSMVFLDRRLRDLKDQGALLRGISEEMSLIKNHRLGLTMLRGLGWARAVPGGIDIARRLHRMYATAVVSNLGNVFAHNGSAERTTIGGLTIQKFGFLVPIREGTPISFGVLTYANELTIGMQYDNGVMQKQNAEQLLAYVTGRLANSLGIGTEQVPGDDVRRAA